MKENTNKHCHLAEDGEKKCEKCKILQTMIWDSVTIIIWNKDDEILHSFIHLCEDFTKRMELKYWKESHWFIWYVKTSCLPLTKKCGGRNEQLLSITSCISEYVSLIKLQEWFKWKKDNDELFLIFNHFNECNEKHMFLTEIWERIQCVLHWTKYWDSYIE